MISRKWCQEVAREWVLQQGLMEWQRRMESIKKQDAEYAALAQSMNQPFEIDYEQRGQLARDATEMLLDGYYDPPWPKIPGFFERMRMTHWTPPMPTPEEWPMGTVHCAD